MSGLTFDLINKRVRFETLAPAVLGQQFTGRLVAFLDPATARRYEDIYAKHAQVYPYLGSGVPDDPTEYNYLKLTRDGDGREVVMGVPWINVESLVVLSSTRAVIEVARVVASDEPKLRQALLSNGFTDFTITFRDTPTN